MTQHFREECIHGVVGGQCRCMGTKRIVRIPCPEKCAGVHPRTERSIEAQAELPDVAVPPKRGRMWPCGCEKAFGKWILCKFHAGFEVAMAEMRSGG